MNESNKELIERIEQFNKRRAAIAYIQRLRREALGNKRAYGQARNPLKAIPGVEVEFQEAAKVVRYCDYILNEFEKKPKRRREIAGFINAVADRYIGYLIALGLIALACAGVKFLSISIGVVFGISYRFIFAGLIGTITAAAIGAELWKRRHRRK